MKYLVDTNILSEMTKARPEKGVAKWFADTLDANMFISVISIGELVYGVAKLPGGVKKTKLSTWLKELIYEGFNGRVVDIDTNVMTAWGEMQAGLTRTLPIQDTLIAATALAHDMIVVTGNVKDFKNITGLKVFNPRENLHKENVYDIFI